MLTLQWGYFPNEVRTAVAPILHQYLWLLPGWCRQLRVAYEPGPFDGADASCSGQPEYRQAHIAIHPGWLDQCPRQRRLEVIHELLHVPLLPITDSHRDDIDRLFEDGDAPKYKATLQEQWRKSLEGSVQDLAFSILSIPEHALPNVAVVEEEDEHPRLEAA